MNMTGPEDRDAAMAIAEQWHDEHRHDLDHDHSSCWCCCITCEHTSPHYDEAMEALRGG